MNDKEFNKCTEERPCTPCFTGVDECTDPTANWQASHRDSTLEAAAAICQRLASEALTNPNVHKDSRTVVHAALLCAAGEIRNLKAQGDGS